MRFKRLHVLHVLLLLLLLAGCSGPGAIPPDIKTLRSLMTSLDVYYSIHRHYPCAESEEKALSESLSFSGHSVGRDELARSTYVNCCRRALFEPGKIIVAVIDDTGSVVRFGRGDGLQLSRDARAIPSWKSYVGAFISSDGLPMATEDVQRRWMQFGIPETALGEFRSDGFSRISDSCIQRTDRDGGVVSYIFDKKGALTSVLVSSAEGKVAYSVTTNLNGAVTDFIKK